MNELDELYRIYHSNIKIGSMKTNENLNEIVAGDILVALYNKKEVRGEVSAVYENYYVLKGKSGKTINVTIDDITEHYPKNRTFERKAIIDNSTNRNNIKNLLENKPTDDQSFKNKKESPIEKTNKKSRFDEEETEIDDMKNNPDNQVDLSIENVKLIGNLIYFKNITYNQVNEMFNKNKLQKNKYWYLLTEKSNEIHIIKNNEKAFQIQPFVNALVSHFLKSQNKLIMESYNQIKISGNNSFSIISNIPNNIQKDLLNKIIFLLTDVKK